MNKPLNVWKLGEILVIATIKAYKASISKHAQWMDILWHLPLIWIACRQFLYINNSMYFSLKTKKK